MHSRFSLLTLLLSGLVWHALSDVARAQLISDLRTDWSDQFNPNGRWTYREGINPLPAVASWQSSLGGWTTPQPGWARSENGNDRIPFWFRSNGTENFAHDFLAGDVVIHTTDGVNGVGNGSGNVLWTSPGTGSVSISGAVWNGRTIGRSNDWFLLRNGTQFSSGNLVNNDGHTRASPFDLAAGTGGSAALQNIAVASGDSIELRLVNSSSSGDFVGTNLTINFNPVPEPGSLALVAIAAFGLRARRWFGSAEH